MKIITLLNEKGGVGKTTIATHIAAGLAINGARVVLVDADAQGHASMLLGVGKAAGLYDLLVRDAAFKDVLRVVQPEIYESPLEKSRGQLLVVPSNVETRNIANSISDAFAVAARFEELSGVIDYAIFDTSPTPSLLHGSIYLATDAILYPTTCEYLSFDGLMESIQHREEAKSVRARQHLPPIEMLGVVPTMYRQSTLEHRENLEELTASFGDLVWPALPQRTVWTEAARLQRTVFSFAPQSDAAQDARMLTKRALEALQNVHS